MYPLNTGAFKVKYVDWDIILIQKNKLGNK